MSQTIVAFVPMRHRSERVKGKNYRRLGGQPLYHHVVRALLDVAAITEIVIDTDSPLITEDVAENFPSVRVIPRPEALLGGDVPMNAILSHDVTQAPADYYLQTHSTNPLLKAATIESAIDEFLSSRPDHDSLFSVTALQTRLWTADGEALNHDPKVLLRTQDLPPIYEENSCMYLFDGETLSRTGNRIGERPLLFPINPHEALDIDDEHDWDVVAALVEASGSSPA
jgi:CMP-N-acetylneuraminic acid synthetase